LCDLPRLLATGPPLIFVDFCVMMMVCILAGLEAAVLGAESVAVCRLAGAGCALASIALGVAARMGLGVVASAGLASDGVSLTGATGWAGALAAAGCVFRFALPTAWLPDVALTSPIRCRTTMPARA
jgi:hypothetical protein